MADVIVNALCRRKSRPPCVVSSCVDVKSLHLASARHVCNYFGVFAAKLTFREPDRRKYPCIDLAYAAGRKGGSMTAAMNAANERANEIFRNGVITVMGLTTFAAICRIIFLWTFSRVRIKSRSGALSLVFLSGLILCHGFDR